MMSQEPTLDNLLRQPTATRRARPPSMAVAEEAPVPLRPEQLGRRESRLGIRSLFGRKGSKEPSSPEQQRTNRPTARSAGIRASLADMSNWSYGQQPVRPDVKDPSLQISRPLSITVEHPTVEEMKSRTQGKIRNNKLASKPQAKGGLVPWDAPPLFKAYPQAIKHATLPASILSPDTILRMRAKRSGDIAGESPTSAKPDAMTDGDIEKNKKKKAWTGSGPEIVTEWTTKIYILVTSGCLLQYSSEGTFDRLPEKVLQLGKASAAFASDAIPGRHWVLQVSSALDMDGTTASDQRSLFSRLPFRVAERRQASNFLMVFESADDMDSWMAMLRREIGSLGGKKPLSETGKPRNSEAGGGLRERPSQRTLVVRDPDRYSRRFSVASSWRDGSEAGECESLTDADTPREQSLDGTSGTNSVISHDGRQLENLRDSSQRLSTISFGQRTVVTSDGSSPSCSPTRNSFPSSEEEERSLSELSSSTDLRLRPNASAIVHRRRSLQTMGPFVDARGASQGAARPPSTMLSPPIPEAAVSPSIGVTPVTPNFSVPNSSSRRFSYMKAAPEHVTPLAPPPPRSAARKAPPPIHVGRPLSMVVDQPSPCGEILEVLERPATRHGDGTSSHAISVDPVPTGRRGSFTLPDASGRVAPKRSSLLPRDNANAFGGRPPPRRLASMTSLRSQDEFEMRLYQSSPEYRASTTDSNLMPLQMGQSGEATLSPPRSITKRASMFSVVPDRGGRKDRRSEVPLPYVPETLPEPSPPPTTPLPPLPPPTANNKHLQSARTSQLLSRRSLPSLVEGPPPAPPPSCALPPIPQHPSVKA